MSEEKKTVEVPAKFKDLVAEVEKMSVLDLSELVKVLEEKFGVSAAAPIAMMAAPAAGAAAPPWDASDRRPFPPAPGIADTAARPRHTVSGRDKNWPGS